MENGDKLHIRITECGTGFDYEEVFSRIKATNNNNNHGIALVQSLSDSFNIIIRVPKQKLYIVGDY